MGRAGKQEELRTVSTSILRSKKEEIWQRRKYLVKNAEKHKLFFLKSENVKKAPSNPKSWEQSSHLFPEKEIEGSFEVSSSIKPRVFWLKINWDWLQMTDDILKTTFSMELKKLKMEEKRLL